VAILLQFIRLIRSRLSEQSYLRVAAERWPSGRKALSVVVHVVDDDAAFRKSISRLLQAAGYEVASYESAQQLLDGLPPNIGPSCILLDVRLPGLTGPELQKRLVERGSPLPIIFLTGHGDIQTSVQAIKAGAADFLTKPVTKARLLATIEQALAHYELIHGQHVQLNYLRSLVAKLTPRERQVFELVVRGKMNKQIAHELGATERTIKAHRHRVMEKLQAQSLPQLVSIAERLGILAMPLQPGEQGPVH
jgi:RNA polymerase sigma factor (sigma-70 family)